MAFKLEAATRLAAAKAPKAPKHNVKLAPEKKVKPAKWKPNVPVVKSKLDAATRLKAGEAFKPCAENEVKLAPEKKVPEPKWEADVPVVQSASRLKATRRSLRQQVSASDEYESLKGQTEKFTGKLSPGDKKLFNKLPARTQKKLVQTVERDSGYTPKSVMRDLMNDPESYDLTQAKLDKLK